MGLWNYKKANISTKLIIKQQTKFEIKMRKTQAFMTYKENGNSLSYLQNA